MSGQSLEPVRESDRERAIDTIVSAFSDDPVERWMFPDLQRYLEHFPEFVAAFGGAAFDRQTAWGLGDCAAVALWLPPGAEPDGELIVSVLRDHVSPERHGDTFSVLEQMEEAHPTYPHWYLPWLGVEPARQGAGLGRRLLGLCLAIVDRSRLPAYLETPNPRTIPFYEGHGFEVTGVAQAGSCPPVTLMLRSSPQAGEMGAGRFLRDIRD
jgi:GNAT superfamily N-acetyltransferase